MKIGVLKPKKEKKRERKKKETAGSIANYETFQCIPIIICDNDPAIFCYEKGRCGSSEATTKSKWASRFSSFFPIVTCAYRERSGPRCTCEALSYFPSAFVTSVSFLYTPHFALPPSFRQRHDDDSSQRLSQATQTRGANLEREKSRRFAIHTRD